LPKIDLFENTLFPTSYAIHESFIPLELLREKKLRVYSRLKEEVFHCIPASKNGNLGERDVHAGTLFIEAGGIKSGLDPAHVHE